jgi:glucosylceramidase
MYWTEGGPDYTDPNYARDWVRWSQTFTGILRNWCRSITAWNFALDERGRPNIGPFSCGGLVTINSHTKQVSYSGQFAALAHFSRYVRRGARVFGSRSTATDVACCGFENPSGERVLVLTNAGAAKTCDLHLADKRASVPLAENSLTTLRWT